MPTIDRRDALTTLASGVFLAAAGPSRLFADEKSEVDGFALDGGSLQGLALDDRKRLRLSKSESGYGKQGEFVSAVTDRKKPGQVEVSWLEQWSAPQSWKKHEGNPIYGPKQSGDWDTWTNGVSIVRNPDNKSYKMFYSGRTGAGIGFAEASIDDPLSWKEHPSSPVLKPRNNWEGNLLNQPRVVKVTDTHWRMYYTGWGVKGPGTSWGMGLAESFDSGVTWKRVGEEPFMVRGDENSPDGAGACVPMVVRVGNRWMMWYTAGMVHPGNLHIHQCLAYSDDGVHWTKYEKNPVLSADFKKLGNRVVLSRSYVQYDQGVFRMWYSYAKPRYRIHYAESLDGIDWEDSPIAPVLNPSKSPAWDDEKVEYPEVDVVDGKYRMWFCGNGYGSVGYSEGIQETAMTISIRSGNSAEPNDQWKPWNTVERGEAIQTDRYVQLKAQLRSENPLLSPALNRIDLVASGE